VFSPVASTADEAGLGASEVRLGENAELRDARLDRRAAEKAGCRLRRALKEGVLRTSSVRRPASGFRSRRDASQSRPRDYHYLILTDPIFRDALPAVALTFLITCSAKRSSTPTRRSAKVRTSSARRGELVLPLHSTTNCCPAVPSVRGVRNLTWRSRTTARKKARSPTFPGSSALPPSALRQGWSRGACRRMSGWLADRLDATTWHGAFRVPRTAFALHGLHLLAPLHWPRHPLREDVNAGDPRSEPPRSRKLSVVTS